MQTNPTSAHALSAPLQAPGTATGGMPPRSFWLLVFVVGLAFYLSEHNFSVSLYEDWALSADEMEQEAGGGNELRRIAYLSLGALGFLFAVTGSGARFGLSGLLVLQLMYLGWCTLSVLWSEDPGMTVRRLVVLYCCFVGALGIGRRCSAREIALLAMIISTGSLMLGVGTELALGTFRPWSGGYRFAGTLHPNAQGLYLAALCLSTYSLMLTETRRRLLLRALFAVGFVFLLLTKSRTSCGGVLLGLAVLWSLKTPFRVKLFAGIGVGWALCTVTVVISLLSIDIKEELSGALLLGRQEKAESLTGRIPIWTELAPYIERQFLHGYGYDTFWTPEHIASISADLQWGVREAHCAYIEALLSTGVIGLSLVLLCVGIAMQSSAWRYLRTGQTGYDFMFALLVFGLENACTESGMVMPLFVPFLLGCGLMHLAFQRSPQAQPVQKLTRGRAATGPLVPAIG